MAEVSDLLNQLLPSTRKQVTKDFLDMRYGTEEAAALNRHGFLGSNSKLNSAGANDSDSSRRVASYAGGGPLLPTGSKKEKGQWFPTAGRGQYGDAWESEVKNLVPGMAADPYKTALLMMFMSPSKGQDPYVFSRKYGSRDKAYRHKEYKAEYWLDEGYRPTMHTGYVDSEKGYLDWSGYAGSGPSAWKNYAPTWLENLFSRSLQDRHADLWRKEAQQNTLASRNFRTSLAGRDERYSTNTRGYQRAGDLGGTTPAGTGL